MLAFYGLSYAPNASKYLSQFVALSPCLICDTEEFFEGLNWGWYTLMKNALDILGIESFYGPNWPEQVSDLCWYLGEDSETCHSLRNTILGPIHEDGVIEGSHEVSVKALFHMAQNSMENNFQKYEDWYTWGSWWHNNDTVPLENIKDIPIRYMYMSEDKMCPID